MFCSKCGNENNEGAKFCNSCGNSMIANGGKDNKNDWNMC